MAARKKLQTCSKGHSYHKSSDCPTCPVCEKEKIPKDGFLSLLSAPANRALQNLGIKTIKQLSMFSEKELLQQHGFGPASLPVLKKALQESGLSFKEK